MKPHMPEEKSQRVIGLEGGGTKTDWVYLGRDNEGAATQLGSGGLPATNFKLITQDDLERLLRSLPMDATHVGIFLAGCSTARDHEYGAPVKSGSSPGSSPSPLPPRSSLTSGRSNAPACRE